MSSASPQTLTDVIHGGRTMTVRLLSGAEMSVFVREMTPRLMGGYLERIDDEAALIEYVCEQPPGWSDTLSWDAVSTLATAVQEVNAPFFGPWLQRRVERLGPLSAAVGPLTLSK